jgi:hypothetical protein
LRISFASVILKGLAHELGENLGDVIYLERDVRRGKMSIAVARPSPPPIRVSQPRETSIMAEVSPRTARVMMRAKAYAPQATSYLSGRAMA